MTFKLNVVNYISLKANYVVVSLIWEVTLVTKATPAYLEYKSKCYWSSSAQYECY